MRRGKLAPFIALAVAIVVAGLFVVLAGSEADDERDRRDQPDGQPAPDGRRRARRRHAVRPRPAQGRLGRAQLLPVELHPVPAGASRAGSLRRAAGGASPTAPASTPSSTTTTATPSSRSSPTRAATGRSSTTTTGSIAVAFGVSKVPETWIIDPNGVVRERIIARVSADFLGGRAASARGSDVVKRWPAWVAAGARRGRRSSPSGRAVPTGRARRPSGPQAIERRIACPVCDGESVFESRNTASENIRNAIRSSSTRASSATTRSSASSSRASAVRCCSCPRRRASTRSCGRCRWRRWSARSPASP